MAVLMQMHAMPAQFATKNGRRTRSSSESVCIITGHAGYTTWQRAL